MYRILAFVGIVTLPFYSYAQNVDGVGPPHTGDSLFLSGIPVASVNGVPLLPSAIKKQLDRRLLKLRHDAFMATKSIIDRFVDAQVIQLEAAQIGLTSDQYVAREIENRVKAITSEEVVAIYDVTRMQYQNMSKELALVAISENLRAERGQQLRRELVESLRTKYRALVDLRPPRIEESLGVGPWRGPISAPVTFVLFSDFECRYCSELAKNLRTLEPEFQANIRISFRHLPLPMHKMALSAAETSLCADEQGLFWEVHDLFFADATSIEPAGLRAHASRLGLDETRLSKCLASRRMMQRIREDKQVASDFGLNGTPAFLLNGVLIQGSPSLNVLRTLIIDELKRVKSK
jgi:protein-disulfide isomerase